eukprot:GHUV01007679.1.p1 GENE.GHUV01007679.1~~GHUV01007679.1.p1  ORF type:complete len:103 (-),score=21.27 GHUV01007679.1:704-1012(-)
MQHEGWLRADIQGQPLAECRGPVSRAAAQHGEQPHPDSAFTLAKTHAASMQVFAYRHYAAVHNTASLQNATTAQRHSGTDETQQLSLASATMVATWLSALLP